ncbi:MAG: peptidase S9 [Blastopirellula sp.]|nr:MAG: peptidase S9 [Blastopirellula sp.]
MKRFSLLTCLVLALLTNSVKAAEVDIKPDVVYGHKLGLAMTMDVYTPDETNGAGVMFMVSGGWYSRWAPPEGRLGFFKSLTDKGFTIFSVRHGSSPKFSIPEAVSDVRRSVRYIRLNAEEFGIDEDRIGVYGMSAGGHLSLVLGTASDEGNPNAKDPVLKISDRVNAVVAFVAPTDLRIMVPEHKDRLPAYARFPALDLEMKLAAEHSPLVHVSTDDPPTLLIAGDQDTLVPVAHSKNIFAEFQKQKVTSELMILEGAGHGFRGEDFTRSIQATTDWFDKHLGKK